MKTQQDKKKHFIACCREIASKGMSWGASGNCSMRSSRTNFLVTASGSHFARMTSKGIVCCAIEDDSYSGRVCPSVEHTMHRSIYRVRSDIAYIVHVHPLFSVLMASAAGVSLDYDIIPEAKHYLGKVACVPYCKAGSKKLAHAASICAKRSELIVLKNHGIVALGKTFEEALCRAEAFEFVAQLNYYAIAARLKIPRIT